MFVQYDVISVLRTTSATIGDSQVEIRSQLMSPLAPFLRKRGLKSVFVWVAEEQRSGTSLLLDT